MVLIDKTQSSDVRKCVIKMLKVPQYFKKQQNDEIKDLVKIQRKFLAKSLCDQLIDADNSVRAQTFSKFIEFGIMIEDIESCEKKMIILKESMSDSDLNIRNVCLKFLNPSFISEEKIEITSK